MASPAPPASGRWLFGPAWDLLLGCGVLYAVVIAVIALFGSELAPYKPQFLLPLLLILLSMPHYGGTLVRIYSEREERRSYAIFSVWITLAICACFVWGLKSSLVASLLLTVYLTWSPWHYTGQNYGIAVMFLRRRGIEISPLSKRLLYLSFVLSFLLVVLIMHAESATQVAYNPFAYRGTEIRMLPLGIPRRAGSVVFFGVGVAYLVSLAAALALLLRRSSLRDMLPAAALCLTQALWFSLPFSVYALGIHTGIAPLDEGATPDFLLLVAFGHAVQYLWVTTYYAHSSRSWHGYGRYLAKVLVAGVAVWTLPAVVFAPSRLGSLEYVGGLALLIAAVVNIHHFILDGAIWKLRSTRVANVLILPRPSAQEASERRARPWLAPVVWTTAGAGAVIALAMFWIDQISLPNAYQEKDYARASALLDRMAWFGRDDSRWRERLGNALLDQGESERALRSYERAVDLRPPSLDGHLKLASLAAQVGDQESEVRHRREALRLDPNHRANANDLAWILATSRDPGLREPDEAQRIAEGLVGGADDPDPSFLDTLAAAYAARGRFPEAIRTARTAEEGAKLRRNEALRLQIRSRLDLYRGQQAYVESDPSS